MVGVLANPTKTPMFSAEDRRDLLVSASAGLAGVEVVVFDGLTVELARELGAQVILRGLRAILDYVYEVQMALMNRQLAGEIETLFMLTASRYSHLSSSLVKQIAGFGTPLDGMVPDAVARALAARARA